MTDNRTVSAAAASGGILHSDQALRVSWDVGKTKRVLILSCDSSATDKGRIMVPTTIADECQ